MMLSIVWFLLQPRTFFPFTIPSRAFLNIQFLLSQWPSQFLFLFFISSSIIFLSLNISSITAFFLLSVHFTRFIVLHIHISNASSCFCSFRRSVQVSAPYKATLHIKNCTSLFRSSFPKARRKTLLFLLTTSFAIAFLRFTSWQKFMLLLILHPKYLNLPTCSTDWSLICMSIFFGFLPITITFVLLTFILIS